VIEKIGGASRDRTDDLIVANDALSQLSYSPVQVGSVARLFYQPSGVRTKRISASVFAPSFLSVLCESSAASRLGFLFDFTQE
jgi:hypothetical protein